MVNVVGDDEIAIVGEILQGIISGKEANSWAR